jgi:hypothetical protein
MSNHAHLLLRPKRAKLAFLMRRLLTGYAVHFNLRHQRTGHLFQNRYKSIVCQENPYLLELVRYIHLNPLRVGLVNEIKGLDHYNWRGHAVLMGNREFPGQKIDEVLAYFGHRVRVSRQHYRKFVTDGIAQGRRDELVGGGRRRSPQRMGSEETKVYDERVLGSGEFVEQLRQDKALSDRLPVVMPLKELIERISNSFGIKPEALAQRNRSKRVVDVRSIICYFAVQEMGHNGAEVARVLNISRSGVSVAAGRGKDLVEKNQYVRNIVGA